MNNIELKQIIARSKVTKQQFAKSLGLSRSTLNRYINGSTPIRSNLVPAIEQALEMFLKNPPRYKIHQQAPRRRMK
jgi:transcriptional regulator with XRE-family HTH domain